MRCKWPVESNRPAIVVLSGALMAARPDCGIHQRVRQEFRRPPLRVIERPPRQRSRNEANVPATLDELDVQRNVRASDLAHLVEHLAREEWIVARAEEQRGCANA